MQDGGAGSASPKLAGTRAAAGAGEVYGVLTNGGGREENEKENDDEQGKEERVSGRRMPDARHSPAPLGAAYAQIDCLISAALAGESRRAIMA